MNKFKSFTFYPITGWQIGPLDDYQALVLQFSYLNPDDCENKQESLFFGMTIEMAKQLVTSLSQHINYVEEKLSES